ncbi:MAG: hypothetical protein NFCOHLIN_01333 [Gammaproteobacteria bacterium]|nr:hypothetical protein [Gammaproteobacteria bacterium]
MRYWWVNQNQTFRQETEGGYLWSPKRKANGDRNPYYEFMREVAPGDLILSFQDTFIRRIGVAQSYCYECPKPAEFGTAGPNWDRIGWKVDVRYIDPIVQIRPADHMRQVSPLLPSKYSPLSSDGRGSQAVYLTAIPAPLMTALADLIGPRLRDLMMMSVVMDENLPNSQSAVEWEEHLEVEVENDSRLSTTDRLQLVLVRRGQGLFKDRVRTVEHACRITKVERVEHLRASHIRPWRDASNEQRLDGENGLLLTPTIDHLFDRGFISFENDGRLLISPCAHRESLTRMGITVDRPVSVGTFSEGQRKFLDFHRNDVFLEARVNID